MENNNIPEIELIIKASTIGKMILIFQLLHKKKKMCNIFWKEV